MNCFYINLQSATDRHAAITANFKTYAPPTWRLNKVDAIDVTHILKHGIKGTLRDSEKACFLSHRKALELSLGKKGHVFILEDDTIFGPSSCEQITEALKFKKDADWDILYTDIGTGDTGLMAQLLKLRQALVAVKGFQVLNLQKFKYFGTTAYIINGRSKQKILNLLAKQSELNIPVDDLLCQLCNEGRIKASVLFPFLTTSSELGNNSSTQLDQMQRVNQYQAFFRQMTWLHADTSRMDENIRNFENGLDQRNALFRRINAGLIDEYFGNKDVII
jgi:GR25 family glycosyltransferase involved in LPS biosynthesis